MKKILDDDMFIIDNYEDDKSHNKKKKKKKHEFANNEEALIYLANNHKLKKSKGFKMKKYQKITMYIYDRFVLDRLLKEFKFSNAGNIYDYEDYFKFPDIDSYSGLLDYSLCNRIHISKKYNSLVIFNKSSWSITCNFMISTKHMDKFSALATDVMSEDDNNNSLKNENFSCENNTFLELSDSKKDTTKSFDLTRKKLLNENLIFNKNSTLDKIKNDVQSFFTDKTEDIYKRLDIPFKRGIILYGEPGNGKSSIIREIIRTVPDEITKVIIKQTNYMPSALSSLINGLDGKKAIIIMEDIDSMLTEYNRSDFLNTIDGVDIKTGLYLIATTNYPEKLDKAIFNRAGRFDKAYKIENPDKDTRKLFFKSRNLDEIFKNFRFSNKHPNVDNKKLINTFVENSEGVPMATLKELIVSVSYKLAYNEEVYIEKAIQKTYNDIINANNSHEIEHNQYLEHQNNRLVNNIPYQTSVGTVISFEEKKADKEEKKKKTTLIISKKKKDII